MPTNPRTLLSSITPSAALRRAAAYFGLFVRHDAHRKPERDALRLARFIPMSRTLESMLAPGRVVLVTGESGTGKSTLLELLRRRLRLTKKQVHVVTDPLRAKSTSARSHRRKPLVDLLDGDTERRLRLLASCGMADATLLARQPAELSEGQRARLAITLAAQKTRQGHTLICDEFAATLDRPTATGLSLALAKWARREQVQVVVATANDDVAQPLGATVFRIDPHLTHRHAA